MEDSSSGEEDGGEDLERIKHMTRDVDEGTAHYAKIWDTEKRTMVKPGWFGGEVNKTAARKSTIAPKRKHTLKRDQTWLPASSRPSPPSRPGSHTSSASSRCVRACVSACVYSPC